MVGAGVLVLALVILVPLVLDGGSQPEPELLEMPGQRGDELRTQTFDLRAAGAGRAPAMSLPAPEDGAALEPADLTAVPEMAESSAAEGKRPDTAEARQPVKPVPVAQAQEKAVTEVPSSRPPPVDAQKTQKAQKTEPSSKTDAAADGGWLVQVGTFGEQGNADRLASRLESEGFVVVRSTISSSGQTLHRVRVGPAGSRDAAAALARRLAAAGHSANIVSH